MTDKHMTGVFGCIPVRTEIMVLKADKPRSIVGFSASENIGISVFNPRGVTKMLIFKHRCKLCGMGWNEDIHVHDSEECTIYGVMET